MLLSHRWAALLVPIITALLIPGCSLLKMRQQSALIEGAGSISGSVVVTGTQRGDVIVMLYREEGGNPVLKNRVIANDKGDYRYLFALQQAGVLK